MNKTQKSYPLKASLILVGLTMITLLVSMAFAYKRIFTVSISSTYSSCPNKSGCFASGILLFQDNQTFIFRYSDCFENYAFRGNWIKRADTLVLTGGIKDRMQFRNTKFVIQADSLVALQKPKAMYHTFYRTKELTEEQLPLTPH